MRYFAVALNEKLRFHISGKSVNNEPLRHVARTLFNYELFFGVGGELNVSQKKEFCVKNGNVLMHAKGEFQTGTKAAPCSFYWLHFDGDVETYESEEQAKLACCDRDRWIYFAEFFVLSNLERVLPILTELNHRCFEREGELVRDALLCALLAELADQYARRVIQYAENKRFAEILAWIRLYYHKKFTVSELANRFSYNPKYLSALFKKYTGQTVKGYITRIRLDAAKGLLVQGSASVKAVATSVGFTDEYYFMRAFKKDMGLTPSEYRKIFCGCQYT